MQTNLTPIIDIGPRIRKPDATRVVTSLSQSERTEIFILVFRDEVPQEVA